MISSGERKCVWESEAKDVAVTSVCVPHRECVLVLGSCTPVRTVGRRNFRRRQYLFHIISDCVCPCITP